MINKKRGDLYAVLVKDDALLDVMAHHLDAVAWSSFVYVTPDMNIKGERLLEAIHHVARALGPPYLKRDLSPAASPTSQKQVRDLDHVVGMQVRQEQPADCANGHTNLGQAKGGSTPAVEK
jgi:hypothetical protein